MAVTKPQQESLQGANLRQPHATIGDQATRTEDVEELDPESFEELLGRWKILYPGPDGLIREDHVEQLELRADGTYTWAPAPQWAKPAGRYGLTVEDDTRMNLYFEGQQAGTVRSHCLVFTELDVGSHIEQAFHWQRTHHEGVVFLDRILTGRRPRAEDQ
jgi:hypothetical protein